MVIGNFCLQTHSFAAYVYQGQKGAREALSLAMEGAPTLKSLIVRIEWPILCPLTIERQFFGNLLSTPNSHFQHLKLIQGKSTQEKETLKVTSGVIKRM